ncbi:hypothetical protein RxyAA322_19200 [Rubrobacter xylanophilus]|uniref:Nudix hydrolase domain-containing protein n=1 Tax=Rubrobacter xylanophilus TaxID=49319 RepID=A0A510HJ89_9ACTN|nr:NUDIX domain-containing protein [Rubrobacter xylanophilus]BBL80066.1 hypothetical protein RxyAA322_19200 [Rubrobacter xylanophilus]
MSELVDVLDARGSRTGLAVPKEEAHRRGLWHRCFHCWICGEDVAGKPYLLLQRRAMGKDSWPGYLDVTAAGHLKSGEEPLDGLRELEEELGLRPEPSRLISLGTRRIEQEIPQGCDRELHEVFLLVDHTPPHRFRLQREEVASLVVLGLDEAKRLLREGEARAIEYADGRAVGTRVRAAELVPDKGLGEVVAAARRALRGERVGRVF